MRSVCVFTGSRMGARPEYRAAAEELGRALAERGLHVVYGGGSIGLMLALADAVLASGGRITGVIPSALASREIAHARLSELRIVSSMHERKALMADLSDAFIALPGGWGTLEEFFEVLTWRQLGFHDKPCGLLNVGGYFDGLLAFLGHAVDEGFVERANHQTLLVSTSIDEMIALLSRDRVPPPTPKLDGVAR